MRENISLLYLLSVVQMVFLASLAFGVFFGLLSLFLRRRAGGLEKRGWKVSGAVSVLCFVIGVVSFFLFVAGFAMCYFEISQIASSIQEQNPG